jgi:hypothetical protein
MTEPRHGSGPDRVAQGFRALRTATAAGIAPPGVDAVRRTVRRRRTLRASLAVVLMALAIPFGWQASQSRPPSPLATPSAEPSVSAQPLPSATVSSTPTLVPGGSSAPKPGVTSAPVGCTPHVMGDHTKMWIADDEAWNTPACAGKTVAVFWVTYRTSADPKIKYRSGQYSLSAGQMAVSYSAAVPPELCAYAQFAVRGGSIPDTLPATVTGYSSASSYWRSLGEDMLWSSFAGPCASPPP